MASSTKQLNLSNFPIAIFTNFFVLCSLTDCCSNEVRIILCDAYYCLFQNINNNILYWGDPNSCQQSFRIIFINVNAFSFICFFFLVSRYSGLRFNVYYFEFSQIFHKCVIFILQMKSGLCVFILICFFVYKIWARLWKQKQKTKKS